MMITVLVAWIDHPLEDAVAVENRVPGRTGKTRSVPVPPRPRCLRSRMWMSRRTRMRTRILLRRRMCRRAQPACSRLMIPMVVPLFSPSASGAPPRRRPSKARSSHPSPRPIRFLVPNCQIVVISNETTKKTAGIVVEHTPAVTRLMQERRSHPIHTHHHSSRKRPSLLHAPLLRRKRRPVPATRRREGGKAEEDTVYTHHHEEGLHDGRKKADGEAIFIDAHKRNVRWTKTTQVNATMARSKLQLTSLSRIVCVVSPTSFIPHACVTELSDDGD